MSCWKLGNEGKTQLKGTSLKDCFRTKAKGRKSTALCINRLDPEMTLISVSKLSRFPSDLKCLEVIIPFIIFSSPHTLENPLSAYFATLLPPNG